MRLSRNMAPCVAAFQLNLTPVITCNHPFILYMLSVTWIRFIHSFRLFLNQCAITSKDVMAHWLRRLLSTGGSWVRLPFWPSRRDLGQVLYLQLRVRFGVKLRYSIRAVVGSASEWWRT